MLWFPFWLFVSEKYDKLDTLNFHLNKNRINNQINVLQQFDNYYPEEDDHVQFRKQQDGMRNQKHIKEV